MSDSEKSLFLWLGGSEKNQLFTAYVQNDAPLPSHMHAVMFSIDKRPCRRCSAECSGDAITVMWKTHHLCHFTSEQNKVSKVSS